jgi:hypothetical protein
LVRKVRKLCCNMLPDSIFQSLNIKNRRGNFC